MMRSLEPDNAAKLLENTQKLIPLPEPLVFTNTVLDGL